MMRELLRSDEPTTDPQAQKTSRKEGRRVAEKEEIAKRK